MAKSEPRRTRSHTKETPTKESLRIEFMSMDPEFQKKLQVFLVAAIVLAGGRAAYIVYERREAMKDEAKPRQETALKADYYVTPKKLHSYDLKSARQLTEQPVWVKVGYQLSYYPYDRERHKTDFGHEAGKLLPFKRMSIQELGSGGSPLGPGVKQVL